MERAGIRVDPDVLRGLSESMDARLQALPLRSTKRSAIPSTSILRNN